jgi:hypothetical protein
MSYNLWNYTNSNPINFTDPTGNHPADGCGDLATALNQVNSGQPDYRGLCIVQKLMKPDPNDDINTYVAAGVAIESQLYNPGTDTRDSYNNWINKLFNPFDPYHTGLGICNISDKQMQTPFGEPIDEPGKDNHQLGLGLGDVDQELPRVAVRAMKRRILAVINNQDPKFKCTKCSVTDEFILAAHAEASNFYIKDILVLQSKPFRRTSPGGPNDVQFDWMKFFQSNHSVDFSTRHIKLFYQDIQELRKKSTDWAVPAGLNWTELQSLSNGIQP